MPSFSAQDLINASVRGDRKERGVKHWMPSKLGSCLCGAYLERTGAKPDSDFTDRELRVFHIGKMFEDWAVELIKKAHPECETQLRCEWPEMDLAGYADLLVKNGQPILYELKSKNSRAFWYMEKKGEGANEQHRMQLWVYLKCLNVLEGRILYLEKDTLTMLEYPVYLNDTELEAKVSSELAILNRAWKEKVPPKPAEGGWQAEYCRWHKQCVSQINYLA